MFTILICMGSSCFARENRENLGIIEDYLRRNHLADQVRIEGSLCMGKCSSGPNLVVNGNHYTAVNAETITSILDKELRKQ